MVDYGAKCVLFTLLERLYNRNHIYTSKSMLDFNTLLYIIGRVRSYVDDLDISFTSNQFKQQFFISC
jgi:hypothetical protein